MLRWRPRLRVAGFFPFGIDANAARIRHDSVWVTVEFRSQCLQPPTVPPVVVAAPRKILGGREEHAGSFKRAAPIVHEAESARVPLEMNPPVAADQRLQSGERSVIRLVVDEHEGDVGIRLTKKGTDCLREVSSAQSVVQRNAYDNSHVLTIAHGSPRRLNLPRFNRHPVSHESAIGVCHEEANVPTRISWTAG